MTLLNQYLRDGADAQARAVLCMFQDFTIEESWNNQYKLYEAEPKVARFENGREQGYVVMLKTKTHGKQLNIIFFQHRVSDDIIAIKWVEHTYNPPTIDSVELNKIWDGGNESKSVKYGQIVEMATWIKKELTNFWIEYSKPDKK